MQCKQVPWRTGSHLDSKAVAGEVEKVLLALGNAKLQIEIREADFTGACSFFPLSFQWGEMTNPHSGLCGEPSSQISANLP